MFRDRTGTTLFWAGTVPVPVPVLSLMGSVVGFVSITQYRNIDRGICNLAIIAAPRDRTISLMKASLTHALLFFEPASLTYSRNKFQIRVLRCQARVMPPLVRRGCESSVMKHHCYAAFVVCRQPATGEDESRQSGARSKNRRPLFAYSLTELSGHE